MLLIMSSTPDEEDREVSKMLETNSIFTQLITWADFFCYATSEQNRAFILLSTDMSIFLCLLYLYLQTLPVSNSKMRAPKLHQSAAGVSWKIPFTSGAA